MNSAAAWHGTCYMLGVLTNDDPRRRTRVRPGIEVFRHEMGVAIENSKGLLSGFLGMRRKNTLGKFVSFCAGFGIIDR